MTREDILRMAREAGVHAEYTPGMIPLLEHFAALVVAAERNSWPAEMEAMERQVNILTDALAEQPAQQQPAWRTQGGIPRFKPQPAHQEPVAWLKVIEMPGGWGKFVEAKPHEKGAKPVYTSPPASKPLTDAQIGAVAADIWGSVLIAPQSYQAFARAIEAAHQIGVKK